MNVRSGPSTDYDIATVVPEGTQARIYGMDPGESWFLVEMEGLSSLAWLYRYMVQVDDSLVGVRQVTAQEVGAQPAVLIQPRAVFVQAGPGMEYDAVTILPKGSWARITGIDPWAAWVQIEVVRDGQTGLGCPQPGQGGRRLADGGPGRHAVGPICCAQPGTGRYKEPLLSSSTAGALPIGYVEGCVTATQESPRQPSLTGDPPARYSRLHLAFSSGIQEMPQCG